MNTTKQTRTPEPHQDNCQCTYCIPEIRDTTYGTVTGARNAERISESDLMIRQMNKIAELANANNSNLQSLQQLVDAMHWIEKEAAILTTLLDENGSGFQIAEGIEKRAQLELREAI